MGSVSVGSELWNSSPYDTSPLNVNDSSNTTNTSSTDFNKKANQEERNDSLISQPAFFVNTCPDPYHVQHSISVESPVGNAYSFGEPANQETTTTYYSNSGESNTKNQAYSYEEPEVSLGVLEKNAILLLLWLISICGKYAK